MKIWWVLLLISAFSFQSVALGQSDSSVLRQWRTLMSYRLKNGQYQSPVATPAFFISSDGNTNADSELQKSIQVFSEVRPAGEEHPQCQYPARYEILRKLFSLAPPVRCPNFDSWKESYGVSSINVMYGSQYLSNPTSSFGHSFFLIDSERTLEYMRVTYNYGAEIPPHVGVRLIIDGLGGGFTGNYGIIPLFHRLHSYNDIENRDIWEYSLDLTPAERDLLLKILWEYQDKYTAPYYFLTQNCASAILETIQVLRPDVELKTSSPLFSAPQEIFRVLYRKGFIRSVKYRPSSQKRLDEKIISMTSSQRAEFIDLLKSEKPFPKDLLLAEGALDYVQFYRQKNEGETPERLKPLERRALLARASLPGVLKVEPLQDNELQAPHEAQGPQVLALGRSSRDRTKIGFRPAFHDLMQKDAGFLPNSAIDVLTLEGSLLDSQVLRLESLTLGRLVNFREVQFYDPLAFSWMFNAQLLRNPFDDEALRYYLTLSPEIGFATKMGSFPLLIFGLVGMDLRSGDIEPFGKAGVGPRIGMMGTFGRFKTFLSYRISWQSSEAKSWLKRETDLKLRYSLNFDWDLLTEYHREETARDDWHFEESSLSLRYSF